MTRREGKVFESYRRCLDWLFARHRFVMKPGLARVEFLLGNVGAPHEKFQIVHVAGTNGKGSTASMIACVLSEHGIKTGLYMSPHVLDFTERISIDGRRIPRERVVDLVERLKPAADEIDATFFEIVTAAAALYFAEEGAELVVAEAGLGGRLDATNALSSALSVITRIAVDHSEILGSDPASIAAEKAGIIREAGTVVAGADGVALDVMRGVAAAKKARFVSVIESSSVRRVAVGPGGSSFDLEYGASVFQQLSISMLGRHQVSNARNAVVALVELSRLGHVDLDETALRRGLSEASSVGRMQIIDRRPTVVADVAHNPDGARALVASVREVFDYGRLIVVLGIMGDKDVAGFIAEFADAADLMVMTRPDGSRAAVPEVLSEIATEHGIAHRVVPSPGAAVDAALSEALDGDLVLITGSHYTVGDVMASLGVGQALEA